MNRILLVFLIALVGTFTQVDAQTKLQKKSTRVYELAKKGYSQNDPGLLYKAAGLLLKQPRMRPSKSGVLPDRSRSHYYDPRVLLEAAQSMIPIDQKKKRRKIEQRLTEASSYQEMGIQSSNLWIEAIASLAAGEAVRIPQSYFKDNLVQLTLQSSPNLSLALFDPQASRLLAEDAQKDPIEIDHTVQKTGAYEIEIKNICERELEDLILMIYVVN